MWPHLVIGDAAKRQPKEDLGHTHARAETSMIETPKPHNSGNLQSSSFVQGRLTGQVEERCQRDAHCPDDGAVLVSTLASPRYNVISNETTAIYPTLQS